jgi:predicted enzyme related to lactoylglutathione lyase
VVKQRSPAAVDTLAVGQHEQSRNSLSSSLLPGATPMELSGLTHTVANLDKAMHFYEDILGFEPDSYFAPTHWQSYKCQEGVFFAIGEAPGSTSETSFTVENIEAFWLQIKDKVEVVNPLEKTPWGTYRFVIKDPDGYLIAFSQK